MPIQQLFYKNAVPVNARHHADLTVKASSDFGFARNTNAVPLTASEFGAASAEYPVVFTGSDDKIFPAAVLGLRENQNAQVANDGSWRARFVPGFVRRYPFIFSSDAASERFTLFIDEEFEGANTDGRGERLFDSEGAQTLFLRSTLKFLQDYQVQFARTQVFCQLLVEHELLKPMQARFEDSDGRKRALVGFQTIDREKLKSLSDETLGKLLRRDGLECIYQHLGSLHHFRALAENDRPDEVPAPSAPEPAADPVNEDIFDAIPAGTMLN